MRRLLLTLACVLCVARVGALQRPEAVDAVVNVGPQEMVSVAILRVLPGMSDQDAYLPLLEGKRVAVLTNHTAEWEGLHLVDLLHGRGIDVRGIFAPEHGFRGTADAGEHVKNSVDPKTGIPILSLYNGNTNRPTDEAMRLFDVLVVDMQDVGLRFYTYYIAMIRMMDACADSGKRVVVLDRPNPMGHVVDGPVLDMTFKSGVGWLPIPVLHGLTMGEIALMSVGEGWSKPCEVTVIPCRNYTHSTPYVLPVAPSPNLRTQKAIYLYATVCLFEGTVVSVGRGTERPFEVFGHPDLAHYPCRFTPHSLPGAANPPYAGRECRGIDLGVMPDSIARTVGLDLTYLVDAYHDLGIGENFFTPMFEKLVGVGYVRPMIVGGSTAAQIRAMWRDDVAKFCEKRRKYLLYTE